MEYLDEESLPVKRPSFLTVLCILTFIGSGWTILGAITTYNTAGKTVAMFSDSAFQKTTIKSSGSDSVIIKEDVLPLDTFQNDSAGKGINSSDSGNSLAAEGKNEEDSLSAEVPGGAVLGAKLKESILEMMSVQKMKDGAIGSFIAGLFTLAGAILMWFLRKNGFYLYMVGILIGIVVPLYIYGNNLLAIGISAFTSFIGLLFIALYALNLKSMK